ncbi:MAG: hypothetical protein V3V53_10985 [Bacteroidales bacterium]
MRFLLFLLLVCSWLFMPLMALSQQENEGTAIRLPDHVMPVLGCWFWRGDEFIADGFKEFIDKTTRHSSYDVLVQSTRAFEKEVTDDEVYQQLKRAAEYAREKGIRMTVDLDIRLARRAFEAKYPDQLQEMLILHEVPFSVNDHVETVVYSQDLVDHYTGNTTNYIPLSGSLLRVYAYYRTDEGIDPNSLSEITRHCTVLSASRDSVRVSIPANHVSNQTYACAMVSFRHLAADVFAPSFISFQREIIVRYADLPLAGISKDEWGFPPCFKSTINEFWYSKHRANAYAKRTGGRDLLEDCLLMYLGVEGRERERRMAINHFRHMSLMRNGAIENDFYLTAKKVFGPDALVLVHPTWYPYPDFREYKKNGLDWWIATRDWAQTDELTPFAVRTSLAKKWGSPVWYNMYYADNLADYERSVWTHALAGGRINYHSLYPDRGKYADRDLELLKGDLMRAESRVRLLNYISKTPLDCPVAVIFGHACTMNWAGPAYDDVGMELVDSLWRLGFPADLIPSSEIRSKQLHIDENGGISYGQQKYAAVVLYHPEFEEPPTAEFFTRAADGPTRLFRIGNWTQDFNAQDFDGNASLPGSMMVLDDIHPLIPELIKTLENQGIARQTPSTVFPESHFPSSSSPPPSGFCRLIDGTVIQVAGKENVSGDAILSTREINGHQITFDAIGVAAVRLSKEGAVEAMAAGGLKSFKGPGLEITLDERIDLALWLNENGKLEGVVQGWEDDLPLQLLELTGDWSRLAVPVPYAD